MKTTTAARKNLPFDRVSKAYDKANRPLDRIRRPKNMPAGAFGLKIDGDCLSPRAKHGQVVIVERKLPQPGDIAVLWFKGAKGPVIKILRTAIIGYPLHSKSECVPLFQVEQTNPPQLYQCRMDHIECIARVHSVIGEAHAVQS